MKHFIRILLVLFALTGVIGWTVFTAQVWQFGNSFKGMGDGAGTESASAGGEVGSALLIGAIWLLPVSPYFCMTAYAFNLHSGKSLLSAYVYSVAVLSITTVIMFITQERRLQFMAFGNVVGIALWTASLRKYSDF